MSYRIIREELKGMGIIDGNDNMIWKSPDNSYTFKISRSDLDNLNPLYPRYMINIIIENDIGYKIMDLRFSEIDAVRILDNLEVFCGGEEYYNTGESFIIPINPTNTSLNSYMIYLENVFDVEEKVVRGQETTIYRDISFKIKQYNPIEGTLIDRVSMVLSYEDINDLAFKLFFESLIDIDFPKEMDPVLNRIDNYVSNGPNALTFMDYSLDPIVPKPINNNVSIDYVPINNTTKTNENSGRISFAKHNEKLNK